MLIGLFRGSIPRIFSKYKFYNPTIFKFVSKKPISRKNRISLQLANNFHKRWTDCSYRRYKRGPYPKFISLFSLVPMIEWIIVPPRMALRFSIGTVVPIEWPSNECSTLLSSGPRTIPIHQLFYTIVVEISRHARQALRIALPNSLCPVFHWFNLFISAATSSVNERQRDRGFQFLCDFAGGRKKMKWRKIDCVENFWQVYIDVIDMVFGGKREKDNIWFRICWMGSISMFFNILLSQKRNSVY